MDLSLGLTPLLLHQTTIELGSKNEGIVVFGSDTAIKEGELGLSLGRRAKLLEKRSD